MKQTSDFIKKVIDEYNVTDKRITATYPLIGEADAKYPFATYSVERRPRFSKDGLYEYEIQVRVIDLNYNNLCIIIDEFDSFVDENYRSVLNYQGTEAEINPDKPEEYILTSTYVLTKNG